MQEGIEPVELPVAAADVEFVVAAAGLVVLVGGRGWAGSNGEEACVSSVEVVGDRSSEVCAQRQADES